MAWSGCNYYRAYSIAVEHLHGMEGVGVRLPVGPLDFHSS